MKLLTTLFLFTFSFATAQESVVANNLQVSPIIIESNSLLELNELHFDFITNEKTLAKKKSYKYIIENTLSGRKNLIFKTSRSIKTC